MTKQSDSPVMPWLNVSRRTLSDAAADEIRRRIEAGEYGDGVRLPSERELAEQLGVSRTVVRESFRSLEAAGYLLTQAGRGRFIVAAPDATKSEVMIREWLRSHQAEFHDLVELRAILEAQALRGASADPVELAKSAGRLIDEQAVAIAEGRSERAAELDYDFHVQLTAHTTNKLLRSLGLAFIRRASQVAIATYSMRSYQHESMRQHRHIVDALRSGDLRIAAERVAEHHLSRAEQVSRYLKKGSEAS